MNPEERELLTTTYKLTSENNEILHSLRRAQRWQAVWSFIRWALVIGSALGAYYYLQPYLDKLFNLYQNLPDFNLLLPR